MEITHIGPNLQAGYLFLHRHTVFILRFKSTESQTFISLGYDPRENREGEQGQGH